jgi:hypothetical protein
MPDPVPFVPPVTSDVVIDLYHGDNSQRRFVCRSIRGRRPVIVMATQGKASSIRALLHAWCSEEVR